MRLGQPLACALLLCLPLLCLPTLSRAAETPQQIFNSVRDQVAKQLKQTQNYTCIETIEREYYQDKGVREGCSAATSLSRELVMRDRLRIDVAVSESGEIFGWHGASAFSSHDVDALVRSGPISSGSFVGFLQNIFFVKQVHMAYLRPVKATGTFDFEYSVPLDASRDYVASSARKYLVAFHGQFSANRVTRELETLTVAIDSPPPKSKICRSTTDIAYQTVDISGVPSRIPRRFTLVIDSAEQQHTVSRNEFQACRAFRGESTISFVTGAEAAAQKEAPPKLDRLPANLTLPVTVETKLDDRIAFTGDPVEGVLARDVRWGKTVIRKGTPAYGVITLLQHQFLPEEEWIAAIRFDRLQSGAHIFLTDASPEVSSLSRKPQNVFLWTGPHIAWKAGFTADFRTKAVPAESSSPKQTGSVQ